MYIYKQYDIIIPEVIENTFYKLKTVDGEVLVMQTETFELLEESYQDTVMFLHFWTQVTLL